MSDKSVKPTFETKTESVAYDYGYSHGSGIACHIVPTLGAQLYIECMGHVTVDADNIREVHADACFSAEIDIRSYSPFELTAHELNESDDREELWKAFEQGTADAINDDLSTYTDEDYSK